MLSAIIPAAVAVASLTAVLVYNRLVRLRNRTEQGWAQIDTQLQRRHDLVPNLVATVSAYAAHERQTLAQLTQARARATGASDPGARAAAEERLSDALGRLLVLAEAYPQLSADARFAELQRELVVTEDRIAYARRFYNDAVRAYEDAIRTFPTLLLARPFGFRPVPYFSPDAGAGSTPQVQR